MGNEYQNFLKHYGIQGMKWGVRRFQNLVFGPFGARGYQQSRAMGHGRIMSGALGVASSVNNSATRAGYRVAATEVRTGNA